MGEDIDNLGIYRNFLETENIDKKVLSEVSTRQTIFLIKNP